MRSDFSLNNILRKNEKKSSKLRVEPSSPQLLGFQSSRGSTKNKKQTSVNQLFIVSFINPDFEKQKKQKFVVGVLHVFVCVFSSHPFWTSSSLDVPCAC